MTVKKAAKKTAAKRTRKPKVLPGTPSALIRLAINDLEAVEKLKSKYVVDMDNWHLQIVKNKCSVCFAGSVMARSLKVPHTGNVAPDHFDKLTEGRLDALNEFREGNLEEALGYLDYNVNTLSESLPDDLTRHRRVAGYHLSPAQFKKDMRKLADDYEKHGF